MDGRGRAVVGLEVVPERLGPFEGLDPHRASIRDQVGHPVAEQRPDVVRAAPQRRGLRAVRGRGGAYGLDS
ncbi:hypothetical protein [Embleya sp. NBC_00888]|uniref:hypothetical protein n=1 Tax=Embleya sp. NBC_00888 TaxID=2975960 RepID=UPI003866A33D